VARRWEVALEVLAALVGELELAGDTDALLELDTVEEETAGDVGVESGAGAGEVAKGGVGKTVGGNTGPPGIIEDTTEVVASEPLPGTLGAADV